MEKSMIAGSTELLAELPPKIAEFWGIITRRGTTANHQLKIGQFPAHRLRLLNRYLPHIAEIPYEQQSPLETSIQPDSGF
jgi:hypothetical protein